jgi:hypothetical protein
MDRRGERSVCGAHLRSAKQGAVETQISINSGCLRHTRHDRALEPLRPIGAIMGKQLFAAILLGCFWTMFPGGLAAQTCENAEKAKTAFETGKALFHEGRFAEAADAFREANRIQPSWKLLYNIGQSEASAKHHGLALEAFEGYLSQGGDEVPVERRDEVLAEVERLRKMVGSVSVHAPAGAAVFVDGMDRGEAPLPGAILVPASVDQRVVVKQGDAILLDSVVRVSGGQTVVVDCNPPQAPAAAPVAQAPAASGTADQRNDKPENDTASRQTGNIRTWGWVTLGLGGALLAGGAVTGGLALSKNSEIESNCPGGKCPASERDALDARATLGITTDILLGAGAVAAVAGILMVTVFDDSQETTVAVSPGGMTVTGRF